MTDSSASTSQVFDPWSVRVSSWDEFSTVVENLLRTHGNHQLVWRGMPNAKYPLHSTLYRRLKARAGERSVLEQDMLVQEQAIVERAQRDWRLANKSALEIMAHIQHYGGPTRLLDISDSPLVSAWFACEQKYESNGERRPDTNARLLCFYVGEWIELDEQWGGRSIPWSQWSTPAMRKQSDWGTGRRRRVWRPPAYNERISAQNAGFLLDGVPFSFPGSNQFTKGPALTDQRWKIGEIRDASSIPFKLNDPSRAQQTENSTPAFSILITPEGRKEIRSRLESNYGYTASSIYPDLFGMAGNVALELGR